MNKIIKKKWLNALKSGKYKQGTGQLRNNSSYCCLGVLCEVTGNAQNRNMLLDFPKTNEDGDVIPFLGLSSNQQEILAAMNDTSSSFEDIAAYISRNVKAE